MANNMERYKTWMKLDGNIGSMDENGWKLGNMKIHIGKTEGILLNLFGGFFRIKV